MARDVEKVDATTRDRRKALGGVPCPAANAKAADPYESPARCPERAHPT
jgi:hypothetical protein